MAIDELHKALLWIILGKLPGPYIYLSTKWRLFPQIIPPAHIQLGFSQGIHVSTMPEAATITIHLSPNRAPLSPCRRQIAPICTTLLGIQASQYRGFGQKGWLVEDRPTDSGISLGAH